MTYFYTKTYQSTTQRAQFSMQVSDFSQKYILMDFF